MNSSRRNTSSSTVESSESINDAVKECVHYILCREGSKIPIKRSEIKDHLSTTCQCSANELNSILVQSDKLLKKIYGYKLVQVPSRSSGIQYIVVLSESCENSILSTTLDVHQRQLLTAALTHIFMSGGTVRDGDMWSFLDEAGILKESDNAGRKVLTSLFTKQMYLKYTKVGENELATYQFEWGQRAIEEIPKIFLLNKMATAFNKEASDWTEQYKESTVTG